MDASLEDVAARINADDPYHPRSDFGEVGTEAGIVAGGRITWNVRHSTFAGGGGEVVAYRSSILKLSGARSPMAKARRGESTNRAASLEASVRRARRTLGNAALRFTRTGC